MQYDAKLSEKFRGLWNMGISDGISNESELIFFLDSEEILLQLSALKVLFRYHGKYKHYLYLVKEHLRAPESRSSRFARYLCASLLFEAVHYFCAEEKQIFLNFIETSILRTQDVCTLQLLKQARESAAH